VREFGIALGCGVLAALVIYGIGWVIMGVYNAFRSED
jgi:hypothetical protein